MDVVCDLPSAQSMPCLASPRRGWLWSALARPPSFDIGVGICIIIRISIIISIIVIIIFTSMPISISIIITINISFGGDGLNFFGRFLLPTLLLHQHQYNLDPYL